MNYIEKLTSLGQSLWYDNIERRLLENGELSAMIKNGDIRGMTSNPAIFNNAIAKSTDYDPALIPMAWSGYTSPQIFEALAIEDICTAADLFLPLYEQTNGGDGYVSLEVRPTLAYNTAGTLAETRRLWETISRPNLMIKIPATRASLPAIRQALALGININVTLIFSLFCYSQVLEEYLAGLEERAAAGLPLNKIASVASFFISRIDTKVDAALAALRNPQANIWQGKLAVASARLAYQEYQKVFEQSKRFAVLKEKGANVQRLLWASTSTKNPAFPDTMYIDNLIGPHTVNTVPPSALKAFKDHGNPHFSLEEDLDIAQQAFSAVAALGYPTQAIGQELEDEGVSAFMEAYESVLKTIEERRQAAAGQLGSLSTYVAPRVSQFALDKVSERIQNKDASLWVANPANQAEVNERLGWLHLPFSQDNRQQGEQAAALTGQLLIEGYTHALLLGMGGSSLAPEVMSLIFKDNNLDGLSLSVLDSTDPIQVENAVNNSPLEHTIYIVSSKSGTTSEVSALLDYFWHQVSKKRGDLTGQQFIAITDPGTPLEKISRERGFRKIFLADATVGGRFSALSVFGLVPAALCGIDIHQLLNRAKWMALKCKIEDNQETSQPGSQKVENSMPPGCNPGLVLGAVLGEAYLNHRDKLTILADPDLQPFGAWLEQLIAESSGKQGKGIVPVDGESLLFERLYSNDRIFVYLRKQGYLDSEVFRIQQSGHPILVFTIPNSYDLGAEFYRWEMAVATACAVIEVNAFDQPDVQDNKNRTMQKVALYRQEKSLYDSRPIWQNVDFQAFLSDVVLEGLSINKEAKIEEIIKAFLTLGQAGDYVAINAYLPRDADTYDLLQRMRVVVQKLTNLATTLGFGPRFLHSTGQLHKGGADNGLFIQITIDHEKDIDIPGQSISFGVLEKAQALGDFEALSARRRRVLRLALPGINNLVKLAEKFETLF